MTKLRKLLKEVVIYAWITFDAVFADVYKQTNNAEKAYEYARSAVSLLYPYYLRQQRSEK